MADTKRSTSELQALLADNNTGEISAQDMRDFVVSSMDQTTSMTSTARLATLIPVNQFVFDTTTRMLWVGDGSTYGGIPASLTPQRLLRERMRRLAHAARSSNVVDSAAMASPPTITSAATNSQTNAYYLAGSGVLTNTDKYVVVGGAPMVTNSSYLNVKSVSSTTGSNTGVSGAYQSAWYIETMTDSPNVSIGYYKTVQTSMMIAVSENGGPFQYASFTPATIYSTGACSTNTGSVTIAFGSSKIRRIRFEFGGLQSEESCGGSSTTQIRGIFVDPSYSIWKPKDTDVCNVAFVGDSYTIQSPRDSGQPALNWARTCAAKLGWRATLMAQGGTGYSRANGALPAASDPLRLADLTSQSFDAYVFALGTNDVSGNDGTAAALTDITAKALTCFQAARVANPFAPIIVVSAWPRPTFPAQTQADLAAAVKAAWTQFADPNSLYIPIYDDPSGNWMAGTSYQGNQVSPNDISYRYIWTDKIHPILNGHYYYGHRVAEYIRDWLMTTV